MNTIIQGNSMEVLKTLPLESIDCLMTSPPYWALRDYKTEGLIWSRRNLFKRFANSRGGIRTLVQGCLR